MKLQKLIVNTSIFLFFVIGITSCSVKFEEALDVEDSTPEFIFQEVNMIRYENRTPKSELTATMIEQYKDSPETFAKDVAFKSFNDKGEVDTEGECGYLFTDTKSELYELYDDINLFSYSQNTNFYADSLRWDSKSEQMIGGKNDMVRIEKEDTIIYGSGFSASGVSKTYSFSGSVSGDIETK